MAKLHVTKKLRNENDILEIEDEELAEASGANKSPKKYEAEDIEHLSDAFLSNLKAGDEVVKQTGEQKHSYVVSFKKDDEGLCLTYTDASTVETVSYDLVDGHWVFNSKDVTPIGAMASGDFSGKDLKAKTLEQSQANWSADITQFPNFTGGTASVIFGRIQKINQELHIVMLGKIENATENSIGDYTTTFIEVELPEEIASKIYDVKGQPLSQSIESNCRVSYSYCSASRSDYSDMSKYLNDVTMNLWHSSGTNQKNILRIMFQRNSTISIPAGETMYFESRVSLDLI